MNTPSPKAHIDKRREHASGENSSA